MNTELQKIEKMNSITGEQMKELIAEISKRAGNFYTYSVSAVMSLLIPDTVDCFVFDHLKKRFSPPEISVTDYFDGKV
jgi:hypothetical protein